MLQFKNRFLLFSLLILFGLPSFAQKDNLKITYKRNPDRSIDFFYKKSSPGSLFLIVDFNKSDNFRDPNFKNVIDSYSGFLFSINPIDKKRPIGFSYRFKVFRGVENAKVDSFFTYALPFKKGESITIEESKSAKQKYLGKQKPKNWKSFAIYKKKSDTVLSIRKGVVVNIGNKYTSDVSREKEFTTKANRVIIEHSDGTLAYYFGFKKNSFLVKEGQTVYPHTPLGTLSLFNKDSYVLVFYVSYLKTNRKGSKIKVSRAYVNPYFHTSKGSIQFKEKSKEIVAFNESILFKELTKKEIKKYKKDSK